MLPEACKPFIFNPDNLLPSPSNEPLNEPLTPLPALSKFTLADEPEITNEPVIEESPFLEPSHSEVEVILVNPEPSPANPTEEVTLPLIIRLLFIMCSLAIIYFVTLLF